MIAAWRGLSVHIRVGILCSLGVLIGQVALILVIVPTTFAFAASSPSPTPSPSPSSTFDPSSGGYIVESSAAGSADPAAALWLCIPVVALSVLAAGVGGWFASRRSFRPLHRALAAVSDLDATVRAHDRLDETTVSGESREVIAVINALLERLQSGFADGSRFAANASHELRTPLAASRAMLQVALKTERDPETDRLLARLLLVNDRMIGITQALLDLASAENELTLTPVQMRSVVADTIALLESEISARRLRLRLRLDEVSVRGHEALLRQLVTNLVRNAVVHNIDGGILTVTLRGGANATLAIENDGAVIDPAMIPTLMQPFARQEERTHRTGGSGLGLAIVSRIVDAHHGDVTLTPRPSGGLIVHLVLDGDGQVNTSVSAAPSYRDPRA